MKPTVQYCFSNAEGEGIYLFALRNDKGAEVLITNYGAIITTYKIKMPDGSINDIVLGFNDVWDYLSEKYLKNYSYFGAAIGRYANRIKDAVFSIDGQRYEVSKNFGPDQLHGGFTGFDKKVWKVISYLQEKHHSALTLQYISKDGEEGFPGNATVTIRFELNDENELSYTYTATTDKATALNLTHHSYFNLDNGDGTVDGYLVKIPSEKILEQDSNYTVTGNYTPVAGTRYDFNEFHAINEKWKEGYDQSFVALKSENELAPVAEVLCNKSRLKFEVLTTEPIVHLYTGGGIPVIKGKHDKVYGPSSGFCLETQVHPNAINIAHFPNTILRPGKIYYTKTIYKPVSF
jgi:aldose 1-epimerase